MIGPRRARLKPPASLGLAEMEPCLEGLQTWVGSVAELALGRPHECSVRLVGPGELVDVVVTERGIAINPKRRDLLEATRGSGLPIRPIEEIKAEVDALVGGPPTKPKLSDEIIGVVKWVDGTLLDSIYKMQDL